jgi:hypothetical protein
MIFRYLPITGDVDGDWSASGVADMQPTLAGIKNKCFIFHCHHSGRASEQSIDSFRYIIDCHLDQI